MVVSKGGAQWRQTVVGPREAAQAQRTPLSQELGGKRVDAVAVLAKPRASDQEPLAALATTPPAWQRLRTLPGLGPLTATALGVAVREASACTNGRPGAAWLGWGPRLQATGEQARWLGSSQRGDSSRRQLLVQGARPTCRGVERQTDRRSQWLRPRGERRGTNWTAVAVANKPARLVWVLWTGHQA
jgi:transposase